TNGTAALTGQTLLNISASGANAAGAQTTYGESISNTHTGTSTNVGLYASASGGTANYAAIFAAGNVGIGNTAPATMLDLSGTIRIANGGEVCAAGVTGGIIYVGGVLKYCDGAAWQTLASTSGGIAWSALTSPAANL